jgi:hypothetical protein
LDIRAFGEQAPQRTEEATYRIIGVLYSPDRRSHATSPPDQNDLSIRARIDLSPLGGISARQPTVDRDSRPAAKLQFFEAHTEDPRLPIVGGAYRGHYPCDAAPRGDHGESLDEDGIGDRGLERGSLAGRRGAQRRLRPHGENRAFG